MEARVPRRARGSVQRAKKAAGVLGDSEGAIREGW